MRRSPNLVQNHDFTLLWIGQTISELGNQMSLFVLPIAAWQLSHSAFTTALAGSSSLLGMVLALLPSGVIADRMDGRRVMRCASAVGGVAFASLVIAGLLGQLSVAHLIAVGVIGGACAGLFAPAETAAIRNVVPEDQLPTALSQNQAREHVATLAGGPLGGLLIAVTRWLPFAADAISYAVSWALLGRLRTDLRPSVRSTSRHQVRQELREGFAFIWQRPFFRVLMVWSALVNLTANAFFFLAILRLIQAGYRPATIGLTETAAGVAGIVGAMAAPALIKRFATGQLTVVIAWSFVPLSIPMIWFNNPVVVIAAIGATMLLNPAGNAGIGAYRMRCTPADLQGRVAAASRFTSMLAMPLAPVMAGLLLGTLGGPTAMAALIAMTGVVALIVTFSHEVRSVPRPDAWGQASALGSVADQTSRSSSSATVNEPSTVSDEPPVDPRTVLGMPAAVAAPSNAST